MRSILASLALCCLAPASHGAVIFDAGTPAFLFGAESDTNGLVRSADDFTLGGPATLRSLTFYGFYGGNNVPLNQTFDLFIYDDSGGVPGTLIASQPGLLPTFSIVGTQGGSDVFRFDSDVTPVLLNGGVRTWLQLVGVSPDPGGNWSWAVSNSTGGNVLAVSVDGGATYGNFLGDLAFQLRDTSLTAVPEPSSVVLIGLGLGLAAARRGRLSVRAPQ